MNMSRVAGSLKWNLQEKLATGSYHVFLRNSSFVFYSHLACALIFTVVSWRAMEPWLLAWWSGAALLLCFGMPEKKDVKNKKKYLLFQKSFPVVMALSGALWGVTGWMSALPEHSLLAAFLCFVMSALVSVLFFFSRKGLWAFAGAACLPQAILLFTFSDPAHLWAGVVFLFLVFFVLLAGELKYRGFQRDLAQKFENNEGRGQKRAQALIEQVQKESYHASIMAASQNGIYTLDLEGNFINTNPAGEFLSGYSKHELVGAPFTLLISPGEVAQLKEKLSHIMKERVTVENIEGKFVRKNGSLCFVHMNVAPVVLEDRVLGVVVSATDVTRNRRHELLQHARWTLLEMLANGQELKEVLSSLLGYAEKFYPDIYCSVSLLEKRGKQLQHVAAPSLPDFFTKAMDSIEIELGAASCGTAAFIKKRVIVEDLETHPFWESYLEPAQKAGLRACWAQPVFGAGEKVLGAFAIYHKTPRAPDESEIEFIDEYSQLVRIAIERKDMEEEILLRNRELSLLYNIASAANKTIEKGQLFNEIVQSISGLTDWGVDIQAKIFIPDGDDMVVIYDNKEAAEPGYRTHCSRVKKGECLCGLAASTEEVVFSQNSLTDDRHTLQHGEEPHGHVIIPLLGKNGLNGVLCLYANIQIESVDSSTRVMLTLAGHQIGMALDNANLYERVKTLSMSDPLTGLANRRHLERFMDQNSLGGYVKESPFSLILFDLDFFKKYNDTYGHGAGDMLLSKVGEILLREIRSGDLAVRYGGEEFLLALPGLAAEDAGLVAERIRKKVFEEAGVTISAGVAQWSKEDANLEALAHRADLALYDAKKTRNQVVTVY